MKRSDDKNGELWQKRYKTFVRLCRGRDDIIAEQKDGTYLPLEGAGLTFERFLDHIHLKRTYAIFNLDDLKRVSFGLFDVDVLQRKQGWSVVRPELEGKREESLRIMRTLLSMGLRRQNVLWEFPTVGFHLLIFFKDPVPAKKVKRLMEQVLEKSGLPHLPFYPRKVEGSLYGDRVQLPLRINLNTLMRSSFIRDIEHFDPEHYSGLPDFSILEEVEPIDAEWVNRWVEEEQAT